MFDMNQLNAQQHTHTKEHASDPLHLKSMRVCVLVLVFADEVGHPNGYTCEARVSRRVDER